MQLFTTHIVVLLSHLLAFTLCKPVKEINLEQERIGEAIFDDWYEFCCWRMEVDSMSSQIATEKLLVRMAPNDLDSFIYSNKYESEND